MAQIFFIAENLGFPFSNIRELSMEISPSGNRVSNSGRKLVLILEGKCRHQFNDEAPQIIQGGDVISATKPAIQRYRRCRGGSDRMHAVVIIFDKSHFKNGIPTDDTEREAQRLITHHFRKNAVYRGAIDSVISNMVAQIREEMRTQPLGFRWRISSLCAAGLIHLIRQSIEKAIDAPQNQSAAITGMLLVNSAKEYMLKNLENPLTFDEIAAHLHVSNGHLARTFKRVTGESLFAYFRRLRLERAKLKLLNSEYNVTEIAAQCGFSSTTLFCRNFKSYTGITPLTYRNDFAESGEM